MFNVSAFSQENTEADAPKKKVETKISEVVNTDSLPSSELLQRAVNWVKIESNRYGKTSGITTGSKAECTATFPVKPKDLNPVVDYTGKIQMKVINLNNLIFINKTIKNLQQSLHKFLYQIQ